MNQKEIRNIPYKAFHDSLLSSRIGFEYRWFESRWYRFDLLTAVLESKRYPAEPDPESNAKINEKSVLAPPVFPGQSGNITLYRGMSRDEVVVILDGRFNEVGFYYTDIRNKAAGYAKKDGYICELVTPIKLVKDYNPALNEYIISIAEALPLSDPKFYKIWTPPRWVIWICPNWLRMIARAISRKKKYPPHIYRRVKHVKDI